MIQPHTLLAAWDRTVRVAPEATALIEAGSARIWSRRALDDVANAWHAKYGSAVTGKAVVFSEPNGGGWLHVFLGLLKADAVVVPLDSGEPLTAQRKIAHALNAAALWTGGNLEPIAAPGRRFRDGRRIVKLTSGSTGTPRALAFTDAQMLADSRQICASMGIRSADINFGLIPFGHSYGLGNLIVPLLLQGSPVVCGTTALPHALAAEIAQSQPTFFPAVPALLRALAQAEIAPEQLRSLRTVISAGAPLAAEVAQAFYTRFGKKIHSFYGSSETGGISYDRSGDAARTGRSVGRPLRGVTIRLGRNGRFTVTSAAVFTLGNHHRTGQLGTHRPADLALIKRGELVLLGRIGRVVKIAGRRLNLGEIEQALKHIPGVQDAFVTPHSARSDALAAAVAGVGTAATLRAALGERLASWKIPRKIVVLEKFPVTSRGKIDRPHLASLLCSSR